MIVVIFESWPKAEKGETYLELAGKLSRVLEQQDGFVSIERFESLTEPGKFLALSFWRDQASADAFRNVPSHRAVQARSRTEIFDDYRLRVAEVIRDYGLTDRAQAPEDSVFPE